MKLLELALHHCNEFWGKHAENISAFEKLKVLSVTGGIPRYLEAINPKLSAEENIYRLCFRQEGILFNEFDDIFHDLFKKRGEYYKEIVRLISKGYNSIESIASALNRQKGGDLSRLLKRLCQDGLISQYFNWHFNTGKLAKTNQYRLTDNYLNFYLKFIEPHKHAIELGNMLTLPPAWETIIGLQFENLVINNRKHLHELLRLPNNEIIMSNPFIQKPTTDQKGCQIDYLIQMKHNTLYLCEIKFSKKPINSQVIEEMKTKIERLKVPKYFSIRPVLIHVNGVSDAVVANDFFANIIDFSQMLELDKCY